MRAEHELNGPTFAHKILTAAELLAALPRVNVRFSVTPTLERLRP